MNERTRYRLNGVALAATMLLLNAAPATAGTRMSHEAPLPPTAAMLKLAAPATARPSFAELPTDLWDRPFVYKRSAESIVFYSTGPNGIDDDGRGDDFAPKALDEYFRVRKIRLF